MQRSNAFYNPKLWSPELCAALMSSTFVHWHKLEFQLRHDIHGFPLIIPPYKSQRSFYFMAFPSSTGVTGQREDEFTARIESQTSRLPSSGYLGAAIASMAGSAILKITGKDNWALFVGQWAPAFLIMGVYNKLVKQHGSDRYSRAA
jgi:hypothetical protein